MRTRFLASCAALIFLACDGLNGPATGVEYRGEPLAVVNGRMTADRNISLVGDVRLAVGWFTAGEFGAARPDSVYTESVIYEPVFPAGFAFGLYDLPQIGSGSVAAPGGYSGAAVGILFAFDDRNKNGALDTYRPGERPVDFVLGTSLGVLGPAPDPNAYFLIYVTELGQPGMPAGLRRGLNLVRPATNDAVPFETQLPLHLDGALEWNLFMCEGAVGDRELQQRCLDGLRPPADAGNYVVDAGLAIYAGGSIGVTNNTRNAYLTVKVGGLDRPDASVELNGVPVPWDSAQSAFRSNSLPAAAVNTGGDNVFRVLASDAPPLIINYYMQGNFSLTSPSFNATIQSNTPFNVAWTDSKDAGNYDIDVYRSNPFASIYLQDDIAASPFTVPGVAYQGNGTLTVTADIADVQGANNSFIRTYVNQSIPLVFQ